MSPSRVILVLLFLLPLPACSLFTPDPYLPSAAGQAWGYAESPVAPDTLEIGYIGLANFDAATTHRFATFRAAEVALQAGKPCFEILTDRSGTGRRIVEVATTTTDSDGNTTTTYETETDYYPIDTLLIRTLGAPPPAVSMQPISSIRPSNNASI